MLPLHTPPKKRQHFRPKGQDMQAGQTVIKKQGGERSPPMHIGLLSSLALLKHYCL